MLDIKQIESFYPDHLRPFKRNLLREYIQYKILEAVFDSEFGNLLSFMGGTAIHLIHGNTRFSEDLDFDNLGVTAKKFEKLTEFIVKKLKREGYAVEVKNVFKGAFTAYLRIPKVLYEYGLSRHKEEVLLIKLDAEPQRFKYKVSKHIINKFDVFSRINTVPVDVLLSQKIYAIFNRKRPVGRDFYDTVFLLGKTKPNFSYLNSKLKIKASADLKSKLFRKCKDLDFKQLAGDVEQFLFTPSDSKKVKSFYDYIDKHLPG